MLLLLLSSIFITLLFFLSGLSKIKNFMDVTKGFITKVKLPLGLGKLPLALGKFIIGMVILLEIVAPLIITLYAYNPVSQLRMYTQVSIIGLVIFTILATVLYHFPPTGSNFYSTMSNLSTTGGLLLLYKYFNF